MTYFLMLLFVFVTLLAIAWAYSPNIWWHYYGRKHSLRLVCCLLWSALGTFFFHNIV